MVKNVPDILAEILARKRVELLDRRPGIEELAEAQVAGRRDFRAALLAKPVSVIAEVKKASPSRGVIAPAFDPVGTAVAYERGGAAALSVLTDRDYFQGSLDDLVSARAAVGIPALRKDFTTDPYHVHEAAAHGADAILLIAAVLSVGQLRAFRELAAGYQMAALVEVHDDAELDAAMESGATLVGVNNRDLRTFQVDLNTSLRLAERMPAGVVMVAESGIGTREQVVTLQSAGYRGFLVGEHLMRSGDPERALRDLLP